MRLATSIAAAVLAVWGGGVAIAQQTPDAPAASDAQRALRRSPREMLELVGMGPPFFAGFVDGEPVGPHEREKLLSLVLRLRTSRLAMEQFRRSPREIPLVWRSPEKFRGEIFSFSGLVAEVVREELPAPLAEKFQLDAWYRCQIVTLLNTNVTVYALNVPSAWKLEAPLDGSGAALGMFIKVVPNPAAVNPLTGNDAGTAEQSLLFVAPRVAWFPANFLGRLRMDCGLFDDVRDRGPLEERECFYQLLAAVGRAGDGEIEHEGRRQLAERRGFLERLARNRELGPKAHAAAERALARAEENADDVVPLFNDPAAQRGKLFVLPGEALRALEVRVDDPEIVERFGIDHYYEVEIVTADSQNNPLVCCVGELPPGMPLGEAIHESVIVTGFFLKSWAFNTRKASDGASPSGGQNTQQLAPLIVAKSFHLVQPPAEGRRNMVLAAAAVVAAVIFGALIWRLQRGDRRALARAAETGLSLPPRIALDALPDVPDDSARSGP